MLNHDQYLFLMVSYCLCLFGEFAKGFEKEVWRVQVGHLHSGARALSDINCQQILTKISFVIFCVGLLQQFPNAERLLSSCVFLQHGEILHCENKIDQEF